MFGLVASCAERRVVERFVRRCDRIEFEWSSRVVSTDHSGWNLMSN